ncbi:hypothetical protein [Aeromonas veronii]|uniref:Transcriptional regulator n=1 Tax=Aeromonas veronii TaxID=654 RepID=A0AAW5MAY6_AERVE|nr:hypothetical protein [Aeromonas veronii]MCR4450733.1 hypothetical protein [Aeromonas veronii]
MQDVIDELNEMVRQAGSQAVASDLICQETGYSMPQSTISRLCRGEGKAGLICLTAYALRHALARRAVDDEVPPPDFP